MGLNHSPKIVTNGLVLCIDAGNAKSSSDVYGVKFDGNGDFLSVPANAAFDFGTGNFTLEAWVYIIDNSLLSPGNSRAGEILDISTTNNDKLIWYINANANTTGTAINIYNGTTDLTVATTVSQKVWNHLAISKSGTSIYFFLNGTQVGATQTNAGTWGSPSLQLNIGGRSTSTYNFYLNAYISNLRILKGTALYTANFVPPRAPLTAIANTVLLTCHSSTLIDGSSNNFTVTATGDAAVATFKSMSVSSKFNDLSSTNNAITLSNNPAYSSNNIGYFDFSGANNYASIPYSSTLDFPTALTVSMWFYSGSVFTDPTNSIAGYLKGRTDTDTYNPIFQLDGTYAWGATASAGLVLYSPPANYIQANNWYNLTATHVSGSDPKIYRNGELSTGHTYTQGNGTFAMVTNLNPVSINADTPRGIIGPFNGRIAAIHSYNRALTAAEVQQNFNALRGRFNI